jgi:hypothetical protein
MATLKYWDGTQYQPIPGPPAGAYTAVGPTAPNASTPGTSLVPPNGFLWVDTGTTIPPAPYVPPQAPPATGFNSFTDPAGEAWVSQNGSAWKKAINVLGFNCHRGTAFVMPTTWSPFDYDVKDVDPYNLYNSGTGVFTTPIAGRWFLQISIGATASAAGQWIISAWYLGAPGALGAALCQGTSTAAVAMVFDAGTSTVQSLAAGQALTSQIIAGAGMTGFADMTISRVSGQYLGSG